MHVHSAKFITGMVLLFTNQFVGWGAIAFSAYMYNKTKKKLFLAFGALIYGLSWVMLGLGVVLAGPDGLRIFKNFFRIYRWESLAFLFLSIAVLILYAWLNKKRKAAIANSAKT